MVPDTPCKDVPHQMAVVSCSSMLGTVNQLFWLQQFAWRGPLAGPCPYCAASGAFILLPWHSQMECPSFFCKLRREFCWQCCGMQRQGRGYSDCLTKAMYCPHFPIHCCSHEQQAKTTKAQACHTMHLGVQDSKLVCLTVTAGGSMPGARTVWGSRGQLFRIQHTA